WLKIRPPDPNRFALIRSLLRGKKLTTVCEEAHCPNMSECWSGDGEHGGTATFMLMGDTCTRACRFCYVKSGNPHGKLPENEPEHLVEAVKIMGLDYVVLTCVTRDDLKDGGAAHFAKCVRALKKANKRIMVEVLISDLDGNLEALKVVTNSGAEVIAHNLETVERLQGEVRDPRANYKKSLKILENAKKLKPKCYTKSSLMLGLGEREEEVIQTMRHLRAIDVDVITFGQYLRPSPFHLPVQEYVTPEKFKQYENLAKIHGFIYCASGPFVRSSYRAGELFLKNLNARNVSR
ncbi:MAG TPA: lipoyl synthase, partial [Candidatus Gracilibacteria bacterium]|nr:lipoyl synthase [Candidatus Gracilibacteria bacterium]